MPLIPELFKGQLYFVVPSEENEAPSDGRMMFGVHLRALEGEISCPALVPGWGAWRPTSGRAGGWEGLKGGGVWQGT